ncbi:MAG TPA: exonuclease domain-containing protein [Chitinophagaceae bacterium]|nr:exonuclease domain-containing protein [Chitinophagaceae bacterium]
MYAIVDIETTGSYAAANGITEISIQVSDGTQVVETYETLVNPLQPIPRYIQAMTGISDDMVAEAPPFSQVAERVFQLLHDKVFVAHNVNFDFSFIRHQLLHCGYDLQTKKLCTVRLSRRIFPGLPSYSLGNLCHSLGISLVNRHRAGGDAAATAEVFHLLVRQDREQLVTRSLLRGSKEQVLPPHVPREHFEQLPYGPGVYYFHNEKGKIVYVGKAKNIRYRVNSHFSNNSDSRQKQRFLRHVHAISFRPCGTELMASLLESSEIRRLWPAFNSSQKRWEDVYGLFAYEDQRGYLRLAIEKNKKHLAAVHTFHYLVDGHAILRRLIESYRLCPKLCFLRKEDEPCDERCQGACSRRETPADYNRRIREAIASLAKQPSYLILDKGLGADDRSFVLVLHGKLAGMGYLPENGPVHALDQVLPHLEPIRESSYTRNLVQGYAARFPDQVVSLVDSPSLPAAIESLLPAVFD